MRLTVSLLPVVITLAASSVLRQSEEFVPRIVLLQNPSPTVTQRKIVESLSDKSNTQLLRQSEDLLPTNALPQNPSVTIAQGTVVGSLSEDGSYAQFFGIPYADSTSGINRFKAPRPAPNFQESFTANRRDIKCVRALGQGFEGTEDCLVASIFTKRLDTSNPLPVIVWVKGKEFEKVHEQEPSFASFMERDVVVVSLNFRESVLGFLCLGTDTAPGNAGLKDIIMGLRWIRDNILQFGGNPNDITLVGHGSGAAAVDLVTLSPMAAGLIHKAIIQSGNALAPWAVSRDNTHFAILVAKALGHRITNIEDLSEIFTRMSVPALMSIINELDLTDNSLAFAPCIEKKDLEGVEPFLVKTPIQILTAGEQLQIPTIMGYVDNEGTIRSEEAVEHNWIQKMNEEFNNFLQPDLEFDSESDRQIISQRIKTHYFQDQAINMNNINRYIDYHGDALISVSTLREARLRALTSTAPFYLYQFSYKGSLGAPFVGPLEVQSAAHSEELAYMFHRNADESTVIPERDLQIGDILVERWTNFAATGHPQCLTSRVFWRPYTATNSFYLHILDNNAINTQSEFDELLENPDKQNKLAFWDPIYESYFSDAESNWVVDGKDEDDNETGNGSGTGGGTGNGSGTGEETGNGSGTGEGTGNGSGTGEGTGNGSGTGGGTGDGSGTGEGTGNGSGTGEGTGNGSGTGGGTGDGSGTGEGTGNGSGTGEGTGNGSGTGGGTGDGSGTGEGTGNGSGTGEGTGDGSGTGDNSASTAIGYTFSIIALFAILNQLHLSQLMS